MEQKQESLGTWEIQHDSHIKATEYRYLDTLAFAFSFPDLGYVLCFASD